MLTVEHYQQTIDEANRYIKSKKLSREPRAHLRSMIVVAEELIKELRSRMKPSEGGT